MKREPNAQSILVRFDNSPATEIIIGPTLNPDTGEKKFFDPGDPRHRAIFTSRFADFMDLDGNMVFVSMAHLLTMEISPPFHKDAKR